MHNGGTGGAVMQAADEAGRLRSQVGFYFADTNYRRDNYLRSLEQDGWVPIAQLLNFNKIKAITQSVDVIRDALRSSEVVEVHPSEPKIKKRGFQMSSDEADRRTVYVEGFPMNADHDSLRLEFSAVGEVALVSMPRHAKTRKFKGFAFVEFATVADASKACQAFGPRAADGWLVVTKIEWIRTRKRYGRIREKCGRVMAQAGASEQSEQKEAATTKPSKRSAEELEQVADTHPPMEQGGEEHKQGEGEAPRQEHLELRKRKKKKREKTKTTTTTA